VGALLHPGTATGSPGGYDTGARAQRMSPRVRLPRRRRGGTGDPRPDPGLQAAKAAFTKASPNRDDTLLPIDRIAADRNGPPNRGSPSLLKPLGRSKELRRRDSQECHGPSAAHFPALSVIPSQDRADTQDPPPRQWPIQGRVTDISALCNANRFLGLVSPWRATVWDLGTEPGTSDCTPGPDQGRCART
jgi:hypothetical protein